MYIYLFIYIYNYIYIYIFIDIGGDVLRLINMVLGTPPGFHLKTS